MPGRNVKTASFGTSLQNNTEVNKDVEDQVEFTIASNE